ncbi:Equilibrative nucleotide transporter 3 [Euphorbia peplus]|nr:Equilibrative nucleotide transporter 3 [Euphorbia peplus]
MLLLLDVFTSGKGGIIPFLLICGITAHFGVAESLIHGGMSGDLACMCPEFLQIQNFGMENSSDAITLQGRRKALMVCFFLGFGSLMSWNSMNMVADYYYELFADYHPSRVLTLVYQPFALGAIILLAYYELKQILAGFILLAASTFMLLLLDVITSGKGGIIPFLLICAITAQFGVAESLIHGGLSGDFACMCPEFLQSFYAGFAASGFLASCLRLATKAVFARTTNGLRNGVMLFLAISTFIELLCILLYKLYFPKLPVVKYYREKAAHEYQSQDGSTRLSLKKLNVDNYDYLLGLCLIYGMSMSINPGFLYENTGHHTLGTWYPLVLIAMFQTCDLTGRYIPLLKWLKLESRRGLMLAIIARFLLVPAFYFTAKYGDEGWMMMLTSFLGLTHGYLTVCVITVAPKAYKGPDANGIGNLLAISLAVGIFAGVALDSLWMIPKLKPNQ